jgi:7,8-dihydropterin-6-yl-methyl-4-(beta-D-ribofuranosyl)aminobenzene 5'-phosphate synthase
MNPDQFGAAEAVNITVLVDNRADLIVKSNESVRYFTEKALLAEHGFSALIHFPGNDSKILWDAGVTRIALMENLRRMGIEPQGISKIALSHGHHDHYAALSDFLSVRVSQVEAREWGKNVNHGDVEAWLDSRRLPIIAHPAAFRERWWVKENGTMVGPVSSPPRLEWEALGAQIITSKTPYPLGPGCWTTGYVPRHSFEKSGRPTTLLYRERDQFLPDDLEEDQAIVIHVRGKGLVVLSGCAHAGIINTVRHAQEISGVDRVHAILGGFHLAGASEEELRQTIAAINLLTPEILVPCHCTGFQAICTLSQQFPTAFYPGVVGATYLFG